MNEDDSLITLDEAAKLIPGADANTLKRMHRNGKLICYRPGKKLLTTAANVMEAVKINCRVTPASAPSGRPDTAAMERSRAALALVRAGLRAARTQVRPPRKNDRDA